MAQGTLRFTLAHPRPMVGAFLSDPARVGSCLAFVQETGPGPAGTRWRVKSPMSTITQTTHFELEFQAAEDEVRWHGRGAHLETRGHLVLTDGEPDTTVVDFTLEMVGQGIVGTIIEPLAAAQIGSQMAYFADQLQERLGRETP